MRFDMKISECEVRKHLMVIVPNYKIGMSFGIIEIAWHSREKKFRICAEFRERQMPPHIPGGTATVIRRNQGYMRQVSNADPPGIRVLFKSKNFQEIINWADREFNIRLDTGP